MNLNNFKQVIRRPIDVQDAMFLEDIREDSMGFYVVHLAKTSHLKLPFLLLRWYGKGKSFQDYNLVWTWLTVKHLNDINEKEKEFKNTRDAIKSQLDAGHNVLWFYDEKSFEDYLIEFSKNL